MNPRDASIVAAVRTSERASGLPRARGDAADARVGSGSQRWPAHIETLDGVRGLAILAVIVFHSLWGFHPANAAERLLDPVFEAGWSGVDLFFVLSGFLITGILVKAKHRDGYYRNFLIRRALRILPLYVVFVAVTLALAPAMQIVTADESRQMRQYQWWVWTFLTNVLLAVRGDNAAIELSHLWSVAVEEQFYLFWPWIVALVSTRNLKRVCIGIAAAAPILRLLAGEAGMAATTIYVVTPLRLDALALGSLAAVLADEHGVERSQSRFRLHGILACVVMAGIVVRQGGLANLYRAVYTVGYSALALASTWLVLAAARREPTPMIRMLFGNAFIRLLGRYSYSLYLFHQLVQRALDAAGLRLESFPNAPGTNLPGALAYLAVVLTASVAIAAATWYLIEHPALSWKDRLTRATPATPAESREAGRTQMAAPRLAESPPPP